MNQIARSLGSTQKRPSGAVLDRHRAISAPQAVGEKRSLRKKDSEDVLGPMKMNAYATKRAHYSPAYKTKTRQKYSLYIDDGDLKELKAYEKSVGVPVSESIRRAISYYLKNFQK